MKKNFFILILFVCSITYSQVQQEWIYRYNGSSSSGSNAMAIDSIGNIYVSGYQLNSGYYNYDYCTIKYNSSDGILQWVKTYNGPNSQSDFANAIAVDKYGNVYVTGSLYNNGFDDYGTVKYNTDGIQQWVSIYTSSQVYMGTDDIAYAITFDEDGNVYVTGGSDNNTGLFYDYATIKYNTNGIQQWVQRYDGPGHDQDIASSITVDKWKNVYVTGGSIGNNFEYCTIKYDSLGVQKWVRRYGGVSYMFANCIISDQNGNTYVAGTSGTIKYNTNGDSLWKSSIGNINSLFLKNDYLYATGSLNNHFLTVKYNLAGVEQWTAMYNGPADSIDIAYSITIDNYDNIYITGKSLDINTHFDYCTIKYSPSGIQQWIVRYNGSQNTDDIPCTIVNDNMNSIYVTGTSASHLCTIKYSQIVGNLFKSNEIPEIYTLYQNYPNPFNPKTKIKFDIPLDSRLRGNDNVTIIIYDILGREITTLVNEKLSSGTYEVECDANDFPSGVYFYKLEAENFSQTKRMVVVK